MRLMTCPRFCTFTAAKVTELEQKLSNLQSGTMHAGVEIDAFRSKIETLEAEKREAMAAFDRKVSEVEQVNADYQTMTGRYQEVKKENAKLESQVRDSKAAEMSQKVSASYESMLGPSIASCSTG